MLPRGKHTYVNMSPSWACCLEQAFSGDSPVHRGDSIFRFHGRTRLLVSRNTSHDKTTLLRAA